MIYLLRRILYAVPIALGVSLFCFLLVHIAPGDPINAILPPDAPADLVAQVRSTYGLDKPLPIQFLLWLGHVLQGDLGRSLATGRSVWPDLAAALQNTILLAIAAATIGFALGAALGAIAALNAGTWADRLAVALAVTGVSIPHYWLGMVLVIVFSVTLNWLPTMGAGPDDATGWALDAAHLQHLILPALTLSAIPMGIVTRSVRGVIAEILNQDYITTLRGKGLRGAGIFLHILKNAAPTTLAVMGLQLGSLMGGSILVETVFAWPGTGFLLNTAIFQRDIPLLQATILVLAMLFVALNLAVDLLQTLIDPRIRRQ